MVLELSRLLDTGLDRATLSVLVRLVEGGAHPAALAAVVRELRREAAALRWAEEAAAAADARAGLFERGGGGGDLVQEAVEGVSEGEASEGDG